MNWNPLDHPPASPATTRAMRSNRRRDTKPEVRLRSALHREGFRFRVDFPLIANGRRVRPDIVFTARKLAIHLDGCYWHRCPAHGRMPSSNVSYWGPKLARNVARDRLDDGALAAAGWRSIRIWEHVPTDEAVAIVMAAYFTK
jgi:DNA mismatch endonuclease (patch repair protein)